MVEPSGIVQTHNGIVIEKDTEAVALQPLVEQELCSASAEGTINSIANNIKNIFIMIFLLQ